MSNSRQKTFPGSFVLLLLVVIMLTSPLASCDSYDPSVPVLTRVKERGTLTVLTTNRSTTYYYDRDNQLAGPEYDMTQAFANSLGVSVKYKVYDTTKEVIAALRAHKGDLAAAGLTVTEERKKEFDFGPSYQTIEEYLVCRRGTPPVRNRTELKGIAVLVAADTSYINTLKRYPEISWRDSDRYDTSVLLAQVAGQEIACTVSDSTLFNIERRYHTSLQKKYTLATGAKLAWMFHKNNEDLRDAINTWLDGYRRNKGLSQMINKYYGFIDIFDVVDIEKFQDRIETRLPQYKEIFLDAARKNRIDPATLAAQSYQESHWDRKAKSPTGVRGMMMLTQPVAKSLGVTSRLNAEENIYAGAKFHAMMRKMVEHVEEPDRTWLALAAYNVGRGHFRDAQALARKMKRNPDKWHELKEVLPLLSDKKYYKKLRYGYARGNEPVRYVMRIRSYEELLHAQFAGNM